MNHCKNVLLVLALSICAQISQGSPEPREEKTQKTEDSGVYLAKNHIYIVQTDRQHITGTYYFGVHNESGKAKLTAFPVMLPLQTFEFEPAMGNNKDNLHLDENGTLLLQKEFKPGFQLQGVHFKIKVEGNNQEISVKLHPGIESLAVATPKNSGINLESVVLKNGLPAMLSSETYDGIMGTNLKPEGAIKVKLNNLAHNQNFEVAFAFVWLLVISLFAFLKLRKERYHHTQVPSELRL